MEFKKSEIRVQRKRDNESTDACMCTCLFMLQRKSQKTFLFFEKSDATKTKVGTTHLSGLICSLINKNSNSQKFNFRLVPDVYVILNREYEMNRNSWHLVFIG